MKDVIGQNAPEHKITASGFLKAGLEKGANAQPIQDALSLANTAGHIKDLRLKYYNRTTPSQMSTSDNCDVDLVQAYSEVTIDTTSIVKFGLHFDDATIDKYCDEASRTVAIGAAGSERDIYQMQAIYDGGLGLGNIYTGGGILSGGGLIPAGSRISIKHNIAANPANFAASVIGVPYV
jgi:hypothetical protein